MFCLNHIFMSINCHHTTLGDISEQKYLKMSCWILVGSTNSVSIQRNDLAQHYQFKICSFACYMFLQKLLLLSLEQICKVALMQHLSRPIFRESRELYLFDSNACNFICRSATIFYRKKTKRKNCRFAVDFILRNCRFPTILFYEKQFKGI